MEINCRLHSLIVKLFNSYAVIFFNIFCVLQHNRVKTLFLESPSKVLKNGHFKNVQK
uniref:Uncharacterized protein n=1 Tax=viral metagenome TaxID=1070528 RepID=A0A6C0DBN9_9ZZZZ